MTKNMGTADRVVRTLLALAIAVLYFTGKISGTLAIVLGVVAVAFVLSSLVEWVSKLSSLRVLNSQAADRPLVSPLTR